VLRSPDLIRKIAFCLKASHTSVKNDLPREEQFETQSAPRVLGTAGPVTKNGKKAAVDLENARNHFPGGKQSLLGKNDPLLARRDPGPGPFVFRAGYFGGRALCAGLWRGAAAAGSGLPRTAPDPLSRAPKSP